MPRVFADVRIVFFQTQLFAARFPFERVVVVPGFFTNQENRFRFLFTFCHRITDRRSRGERIVTGATKNRAAEYDENTTMSATRLGNLEAGDSYVAGPEQMTGQDKETRCS